MSHECDTHFVHTSLHLADPDPIQFQWRVERPIVALCHHVFGHRKLGTHFVCVCFYVCSRQISKHPQLEIHDWQCHYMGCITAIFGLNQWKPPVNSPIQMHLNSKSRIEIKRLINSWVINLKLVHTIPQFCCVAAMHPSALKLQCYCIVMSHKS